MQHAQISKPVPRRLARYPAQVLILTVTGFLARAEGSLLAFDCAGAFWLTPREELQQAAFVFHGEAKTVEPGDSWSRYTFEVLEVWKGPVPEGPVIVDSGNDVDWGGFPFTVGREYIVYAWSHGDGEFGAGSCSRTGVFRPAEAEALGEPIWTAPGRRVAFRRGDVDASGELEITDAVASLGFQFLGDFSPPCISAVDTDDSGEVDVSDPILALRYQFLGGPPPSPPFTDCGEDPTDDALTCSRFDACLGPVADANEIVSIVTDKLGRNVTIELFSDRAFPVRALDPALFIGERIFTRYDFKNGDLHTLLYTLTLQEFERLPAAAPVSVQYSFEALPGSEDFWDFGILDKSMLER